MNGYILISRKIVESKIWDKPPLYLKLWMWLLCNAQYTEYKGLRRGQLWTTYDDIREALSWHVGSRKETPTKNEIYRILNFLRNPERDGERDAERDDERDRKQCVERDGKQGVERDGIITTKGTRGILVTICKYNDYQDPKTYERDGKQGVERDGNLSVERDSYPQGERDGERDPNETRPVTGQMKQIKIHNKQVVVDARAREEEQKVLSAYLTDSEWKKLDEKYDDLLELIDLVDDQVDSPSTIRKPYAYICKIAESKNWARKRKNLFDWARTI